MHSIGAMTEATAMASAVSWDIELFERWSQGGVELYCEFAWFAQLSSDLVEDLILEEISIPGVWAYEVSEVFGSKLEEMIRKDGADFNRDEAKFQLGELAHNLLEDGGLNPEEVGKALTIIQKWTEYTP